MSRIDRSDCRAVVLFLATVALALSAGSAVAQDANYWTLQHGNQARLLGGAVVGGSEDLSSTYYNPARLAMLESSQLLLAGNVFDYTSLSIKGAVGGKDFHSTRLGSVPSLFAGRIGSHTGGGSRWAYSFLGRYISDIRFDEWREIDDYVSYPVDQAVGSFTFDESMSEYWAGLTWARNLGDHVAFGVTGYVAVRNQDSRSLIMAQAARADTMGLAIQRRNFDFTHVSTLAKIGLSADLGALKLGLVATTPNLKVYGQGSMMFDESFLGEDLDADGNTSSQLVSGYQDGLSADHKAAPSLSAGMTYDWDVSSLHVSTEWFAGVADYRVLDVAPVRSSDGQVTREPDVRDARRAVFNVGLGFEHRFKEHLQGFVSFRTDFSSLDHQNDSQIAVSIWDIYHVGGGATFQALKTTFTLGLIYAFGGAEEPPTFGLVPDGGESDAGIASGDENLEYRYRRLTGLVGFAFGF